METDTQNKKNTGLLEMFDSVAFAIAFVALVFTFAVRTVRVVGHSMDTTLHDGQMLLTTRMPYSPKYGDIVVVDNYTPHGKVLIKRVIGDAGDTIDIDFEAGVVYRNGVALDEPYTAEPTYLKEGMEFPAVVPEGCVFLMGDNRNNSKDSRDVEIGFVDVRNIMGKVL